MRWFPTPRARAHDYFHTEMQRVVTVEAKRYALNRFGNRGVNEADGAK